MSFKAAILISLLSAFAVCASAYAAQPACGNAVKGKAIFEKQTCAVCHPGGGNNIVKNKPLKGAAFAKTFSTDAKLVALIRNGVKGTAMPAFPQERVSDADMK